MYFDKQTKKDKNVKIYKKKKSPKEGVVRHKKKEIF